jgi:hypothetical protein
MYNIIGADWKEYGPVSADAVRQWIKDGRATAQTRVQVEGTREWRLLGQCPEFADALPLLSAPTASGQPPAEPDLVIQPRGDRRTNGFAIAGLILGSFCFIQCCGPVTGSLGVLLSILGLVQIHNEPQRYKGKEMAIAGLALSLLGFLITALLFWSGAAENLEKMLREALRQ